MELKGLSNAIKAYRKIKDGSDVTAFVNKVERALNSSITATEAELKELQEDLQEKVADRELAFVDDVLNIDVTRIKDNGSRKAYAEEWLTRAAKSTKSFNDSVAKLKAEIQSKKDELNMFKELAKELVALETKVAKAIEESND